MKFAVIDVETTGLNPNTESVIEIGIILIDKQRVVSECSWLIRPAKPISPFITRLTGITNEIVSNQPAFKEISPIIDEMLKEHILVGHNILFDYSFLKNEMKLSNISFSRQTICTKEFSRFMVPGKQSYSLNAMSRLFKINNHTPHRALSDAKATAELFLRYYLEMGDEFVMGLFEKRNLFRIIPEHLRKTVTKDLPAKPGVYYFMSRTNKPFYIGKASNIRQRVLSHFRGDGNSLKILALAAAIKEIRYAETGNELIALLLEDHEIRHFWPKGNHSQKHRINRFGVVTYLDRFDRWRMAITRGGRETCLSVSFHQYHTAAGYILKLARQYNLDHNLCGIPSDFTVDLETHNNNFKIMLEAISRLPIITEVYFFEGRNEKEKSFILLEDGFYKGFGFIENEKSENPKELYSQLTLRYSSITTENIIRQTVQPLTPDLKFTKVKYRDDIRETGIFDRFIHEERG